MSTFGRAARVVMVAACMVGGGMVGPGSVARAASSPEPVAPAPAPAADLDAPLAVGVPAGPKANTGLPPSVEGAPAAASVAGGSSGLSSLSAPVSTGASFVGPSLVPRIPTSYVTPPYRANAGSAFDSVRNETVVFGGDGAGTARGDTWVWNGRSWTQKSPVTSPSARWSAAMVFDVASSQVVLFGGRTASGTMLSDTWVWNGSTWTQKVVTGPSARVDAAIAYVPGTGVVLFGGDNGSTAFSDTWKWSGTAWTQITTTGTPPARSDAHMAWLPGSSHTVLFGGQTSTGTKLADTWTLAGSTWTAQSPSAAPSGRANFQMAYDSALSSVVVFGGYDGTAYLNDLWVWTGSTWASMWQHSTSWGVSDAILEKSPANGQLVMFGGRFDDPTYGPSIKDFTYSVEWPNLGQRDAFVP